ncbi:hypothetical protein [Okeania sp. SIO2B3]|uniref:hypothetical protein n=1 Tax=Okeania sp. SIO2B3 TaxID=2607784 RepID=UPI0025F88E27|nr:hypothetical protein [Okeania sp. SIO2B3]
MLEPSTVIVISSLLVVFMAIAKTVRSFELTIISSSLAGLYMFWVMHQAWLNFLLTMKEISGN